MNVLVLNCGSATLKFQLIETEPTSSLFSQDRKLARGLIDRIGGNSTCRFEGGDFKVDKIAPVSDHDSAVQTVLDWLGSVRVLPRPDAVGHRVVHGGDRYVSATLIGSTVEASIEELSELAPLHNPAALSGIRGARRALGDTVPMVAVFDTAFHHTIPPAAASYAIPHAFTEKYKIRRYGFHGVAHEYGLARYAELNGKQLAEVNGVILHLGNGCSVCAIRNGRSVETSMGFTPLEGLVMGTRSGDVDPALVSYLARKEGVGAATVESWLNERSGLLGISGQSSDMRELTAARDVNRRARLAVEVFCHRARKYLGAYLAVVGGAEVVIFSGGIGENAPSVREEICRNMQWCGLDLDAGANAALLDRDDCISSASSRLAVWVVHTDEEAIIARQTAQEVAG